MNLISEDLYPELWDADNNSWIEGVEEPTAFYIQKKFRKLLGSEGSWFSF